ncbi:hypothetical protein OCU04_001256 [Sclerotinia nivalis]|uniref:Vacuolar aspartyl aminopeptidase Lap4 n=1 Tax=Sclerotinia nivalis TaxID=352851 RepID=A0A9X0AXT2_9HELO|nr:hypothetical protein OCU04_001256 [Sclerotinia nivalis]
MVKNKPSTAFLHKTTIPKETMTTGMSSNMSNETIAKEANANVSYDMPSLHKITTAQETAAQEAVSEETAWKEADRTRISYTIPPLPTTLYKGRMDAALASMSSNKPQRLPIRSLRAIAPGEHENQRVQNPETHLIEEQNAQGQSTLEEQMSRFSRRSISNLLQHLPEVKMHDDDAEFSGFGIKDAAKATSGDSRYAKSPVSAFLYNPFIQKRYTAETESTPFSAYKVLKDEDPGRKPYLENMRRPSFDNSTNSEGIQSSMDVDKQAEKSRQQTEEILVKNTMSWIADDNARYETLYKMMEKSNGPSSIETGNDITSNGQTLFEQYRENLQRNSFIANGMRTKEAKIAKKEIRLKEPEDYAEPFINFMTENPTVWHAIQYWENKLEEAGFSKLSPRESWNDILEPNGKYYVNRNGTSLIAFSVGGAYESGNGIAMVAAHSDSLTARLKPISTKNNKAGYVQLGVAPYAGALNETWWDRDLGIGGRVLVRDESGSISQKLVKLGWPIARIPTLAPHFGVGMFGQNNKETQLVPIIGLDNSDASSSSPETFQTSAISGVKSTFISTQPPKLVNLIAKELGIENKAAIINWELELFDTQPAQLGGLEKDLIFSGRIDDKVCSWSSIEALVSSSSSEKSKTSGIISMVGLFDDEEIGSLLRQGANSNFLPGTVERVVECFNDSTYSPNVLMETYAKSFLVSFDVTHATNPNFLEKYLENHAPRLNVGLTVEADSNGHTTTDSVSTAIFQRLAEKCGQKLQTFMIRNDSRSGGTVGPMLSSKMGVRAIDVGIPQLSMHSIRATTGSKDPGLGVKMIEGVFLGWEDVDAQFAAGKGW